MTIRRTLLSRGYLPKELPPHFHSASFARYACSKAGRSAISSAKLANNFAECVAFNLALPGLDYRPLRIPHPKTYTDLVQLVARSFRRLLKKSGASAFSRSRPVYSTSSHRAIRTLIDPANLPRERALSRTTGSFILRADISQFYPSLYTHAVGWAIDPKLRLKSNWHNRRLLGKQIDQQLMDMQGKVSQGVPIGTDISFLLSELVLSQVDKRLHRKKYRAVRWFDDYEVVCDSRAEAEEALGQLRIELAKYNLRLNPKKTAILELPLAASDTWQRQLVDASQNAGGSARSMLSFFDTVFEMRSSHTSSAFFLYALGLLFRFPNLSPEIMRVAEACICQSMLTEPGCAQKAFSLLTYWDLNGTPFDRGVIAATVDRIVLKARDTLVMSDVSWALAFCIDHKLHLAPKTARFLSQLHDDCTTVQALHANRLRLFASGFSTKRIETTLKGSSTDGQHWLALYESVRHAFLPSLAPIVKADPLMNDLLKSRVSFYRLRIAPYSAVLHPGGAPQWVVRAWLAEVLGQQRATDTRPIPRGPLAEKIIEEAMALDGLNDFTTIIERLVASSRAASPLTTDGDDASDDYV